MVKQEVKVIVKGVTEPTRPTRRLASLKFLSNVSAGVVSGADLIIPATAFVDDNGNSIVTFPSVFQYYNLYINGMIQLNGSVSVIPSAVIISDGAALDSHDPVLLEFIV
ncbi:MAG: DUF4183 domain-containing protein [Alicyclobacillus sp.]|nr:DUF4183 domain-containing protein [Alicyclobacillus sp.]